VSHNPETFVTVVKLLFEISAGESPLLGRSALLLCLSYHKVKTAHKDSLKSWMSARVMDGVNPPPVPADHLIAEQLLLYEGGIDDAKKMEASKAADLQRQTMNRGLAQYNRDKNRHRVQYVKTETGYVMCSFTFYTGFYADARITFGAHSLTLVYLFFGSISITLKFNPTLDT
jgi:hypothetical protein